VPLSQWLNPNALRLQLNRWLRPLDLGVYRPSLVEAEQGVAARGPLPEGAAEVLRADHPRLLDLARRYRGHPAAARSGWSDLRLQHQIDLCYFRGDSQYLYQRRGTPEAAYALAADYVVRHGVLGLLDRLGEDGAFGAVTFEIDGRRVGRDLLDSALEIEALAAWLGADRLAAARVLDVGAGYGRLAHRLCSWSPDARVVATDAVPLSTLPTTPRVPAARIGALDRGIAWPRKSGEALRTTKAPRVRTSMCVTLTTFTLTKPLPKRPCGTTVHARQGS